MPARRAHLRTGTTGRSDTRRPTGRLYSSIGRPRIRIALPPRLRTCSSPRGLHADQVCRGQAGGGAVEEAARAARTLRCARAAALAWRGWRTGWQRATAAGTGPGPGPPFEMPGVGDPLLVAGDREVLDQVTPTARPAVGAAGSGTSTASERTSGRTGPGTPSPWWVDGGGVDAGPGPGERQRPSIFARTGGRPPPEPGPGVLRALPPVPGLEPRIPGPLGEERGVAACWCRNACCSGTQDTSFSQRVPRWLQGGQVGAGLGVVVPVLSPVPLRRQARSVHTTRTQPNVRSAPAARWVSPYAVLRRKERWSEAKKR